MSNDEFVDGAYAITKIHYDDQGQIYPKQFTSLCNHISTNIMDRI